jgi:Leucine-rich repeat (LRR) protein
MSVINEKRENIMRNNNTAQDTLVFLLEKMNPNTKELIIGVSLHGDVDFSVLKTNGFRFVSTIRMTKPGEITTVSNLPNEIKVFDCPNQLLVEFTGIFPYLEELNLEGNYVRHMDFIPLPKLKILNINNNRMTDINQVPYSLEELYINRNGTRVLNLKNVPKLRVLHSIGNDMIRIQNVPASMVDLQIEENPMVDIGYTAMPTASTKQTTDDDMHEIQVELDYVDSMNAYFRLKQKYETDRKSQLQKAFEKGKTRKQGSKLAKEARPKCIRCRRPFGTIFECRDRRFIAVCGNKNDPCDLNIQLYRGNYSNREYMLYLFREQMEDLKDNIISQKLDTLFSYISEEKSAEKFKRQLKDYSIDNNIYKELLNEYTEIHSNPHKRELIRNKIRQIYELKNAMKQMLTQYETDENAEIMGVITDIYVREYLPEIHNLRLLCYEVMEMSETGNSKETDQHKEMRLFQKNVSLSKVDYITGEPPRVIAYTA